MCYIYTNTVYLYNSKFKVIHLYDIDQNVTIPIFLHRVHSDANAVCIYKQTQIRISEKVLVQFISSISEPMAGLNSIAKLADAL